MACGPDRASTTEEEQQYLRFGCLRSFNCKTSSVNCVRFFGDADHVIAGASDRTIYLLSAQNGILHEFAGEHTDVVACVSSADSLTDIFLSGGLDRRGILWSVTTGEAVRQFPRTSIGDAEGRVRLFDIRSQNNRFGYVQVLTDAKDGVSRQVMADRFTSILATQDKLLVASLDGCVYTYDLRKGTLNADCYGSPITWQVMLESASSVDVRSSCAAVPQRSLSLSSDETVLLASCMDASVRLIEASTGECLHAFWGHRQTASGAFRLCSDFITSSRRLPNKAAAACLFSTDFSASDQEPQRAFDELLEVVQRSSKSAGGLRAELAAQLPYAVSGSEDCCVYFWDVQAAASGVPSSTRERYEASNLPSQGVHAPAHDAPTLVVKTDPLSQRLCTASTDGTVKLWRQL